MKEKMKTDQKSRGRGRPRKAVVPGERYLLTARLTPETRMKIEQAAGRNGRSLTQEAEARLEQLFRDEELLGGPGTADVLLMLARVIRKIEEDTGKPWRQDYDTALVVNLAAARVLQAYSPDPPDEELETLAAMDILDRQEMEIDPETDARLRQRQAARERAYTLTDSLFLGGVAAAAHEKRKGD
jgi:hypothetical protein